MSSVEDTAINASGDDARARPRRRVPSPRLRRLQVGVVGTCLVIGFLLLVFWRYIFVTILPGHVGVLYSWFFDGIQVGSVYGEGLAIKLPWNRIYIIETRVRVVDHEMVALSAEGMPVQTSFSVLFRVKPEMAGYLLKEIGPDYQQRVVDPVAFSTVRTAISRHASQEFYTESFDHLEDDVAELLAKAPYRDIVVFERLVVRQIELPKAVTDSINEKLMQEQLTAAYGFRLERERQEAERRRIEAIGIQNFYSVVSSALTPNLLTWRGIEATVELSRSPNSKIVIVGSGEDQLPLILGSDIHNLPAAAPTQPVHPDQVPEIDWPSLPSLFPRQSDSGGMKTVADGVDSDQPNSEDGLRAPDADDEGLRVPEAEEEGFRSVPEAPAGDVPAYGKPYGATP
jgi:prohibitin 2